MANSPLARVQRPRPSQAQPKLTPPEYIHLPDGREIRTQDLLCQVTNKQNYNLRNKNPQQPINRNLKKKYSEADLRWMATAEVPEIEQRFGVNAHYAACLRTRARNQIRYFPRI